MLSPFPQRVPQRRRLQDAMATPNRCSFASDDEYQHPKPLSINEYTEKGASYCVMADITQHFQIFIRPFYLIQSIVSVFQDFLVHFSLISGKIGKHQHFLINLKLIAVKKNKLHRFCKLLLQLYICY